METDDQMRELQVIFLEENGQALAEAEETLLALDRSGFDEELVNLAFRLAHNFKGSAKSIGFAELGNLAHRYEDVLSAIKGQRLELNGSVVSSLLRCNDFLRKALEQYKRNSAKHFDVSAELHALDAVLTHAESSPATSPEMNSAGFGFFNDELAPVKATAPRREKAAKPNEKGPAVDEILKIPAKRLDALLNIVGELVVNQSIIDGCRSRGETHSAIALQSMDYMSKLVADMQNLSLGLRLVPIRPLFQKLRRTARDTAEALGKNIELVEEGEHCELDKNVIEHIADPLNHMIRNAIDHGVDTAAEREQAGKTPQATIRIAALAQDDQVKIVISDDGRGLNRQKIIEKALANNLIDPEQNLTEQQIFSLIFAPGFSTKDVVSDVSGRGVGMEVVQRAVDELKGQIQIESSPGRGTSFEITLPLSLSIVGGMVIQANNQSFVIPVSQLTETVDLCKYPIETVTGLGRALNLRGEIVAVYNLADLLNRQKRSPRTSQPPKTSRPALVTSCLGRKVSFEVDLILSQQKVVLKRLGREFEGIPGIVAGTILSNGEPGLVLSLDKLISEGAV